LLHSFTRHRDHLDLHSFPTRRSSDLILEVHAKGKPLEPNVRLDVLARRTPGFTGADLANLMNEAALLAARRGLQLVGHAELEAADRKSTRLNSSHVKISYAVFCLKKK